MSSFSQLNIKVGKKTSTTTYRGKPTAFIAYSAPILSSKLTDKMNQRMIRGTTLFGVEGPN